HRIAVLELAADARDEVEDQVALTSPRVGVVTSINRAHFETFGSIEAIECEKASLVKALPVDGLAVLNRDDERVWRMREQTPARTISYGFHDGADYVARDVHYLENGLTFELLADRGRERVSLALFGRHHVYAALAAIAVGRVYGVPLADILNVLRHLQPLAGRLSRIEGDNGAVLLDDTYDAGADCTLAALDALADHFPAHKRIVVLGDMRQLGVEQNKAYRQVGERVARLADHLILKGDAAQEIRQAALMAGMDESRMFFTFTNQEAARYLASHLTPDCAVLIKGGRQERMEEVVLGVMRAPERAATFLVRQEAAFRHVQLALPARPTWLEVDLDAIAHNLHLIRRIVGEQVGVMVVLKADGYGHGAIRIAQTAVNNGAAMLAVACLSEGVALRRAGIQVPILILGYTPAWQAREAILNDLTATVFDLDTVRAFSRAAGEVGGTARVHVKVDSGMGRLGLLPQDVLPFLRQAFFLPDLIVEGIFTHFSVADEADKGYTQWQLARFEAMLADAGQAGFHFPLVHASNSAAIVSVPQARFNMVRLGIALYGMAPSADTPLPDGFRLALSFTTRIAQVKTLPPGSFVSYGNTYRTQAYERIAVIPVGYADGFRRAPAHWREVLVRGRRAPIVGRVCMDQTMIDVTHVPDARQGDEVVLIGKQGDDEITVEQVAEWLGTINYEVVSEILARVPRVS
ncbi:MAG: alanine racemase, partial [Anaerolineae bacterium]|nr:alanine racemase [Anaerolineae bacterium]